MRDMAITKIPQATRLVLKVQTGTNGAGNPVYRQRAYRNVKTDALDSDIHAVGQAMAALQKYPVESILRMDDGELINA